MCVCLRTGKSRLIQPPTLVFVSFSLEKISLLIYTLVHATFLCDSLLFHAASFTLHQSKLKTVYDQQL